MSRRCRLLAASWIACVLAGAPVARGQDKSHAKPAAKASAAPKRKAAPQAKAKPSKHRGDTAAASGDPSASAAPAAKPEPARRDAKDARSTPPSSPPPMAAELAGNVHSERGTEVKTLEFSGLDIEGQLKSPQMLYFLKRVRAEFEHPRLPHRSFMPELARSVEERDF